MFASPVPIPSIPEGSSILVVMAHPDDAEFIAGGTIAAWASAGKIVNYLLCTSGDKGSSDPSARPVEIARTRRNEQINAAHALGATDVHFLSYLDGTLENTIDLRRDIVRWIRRLKPDAVICQDPTQRWAGTRGLNHPDHRAAGDACLDAVYPSARDPHVFPEVLVEGLQPHKVVEVFVASQSNVDVWIDISATFETKLEGLKAHVSQTGHRWDDTAQRIRERSQATAVTNSLPFSYAEGFKYIRLS